MTADPRAFFALDLGIASTAAALVGRVGGRWRLLAAATWPAGVAPEAILELLAHRLAAADPGLAREVGEPEREARLVARSAPARELAVVAVSERSRERLAGVAARAGWRLRTGSAEALDPLAMTTMLLDPDVSSVLVGAGEPPGADERAGLGDLGALVAAAAGRRPELAVVLAGAMVEQASRFEMADRTGELLLAAAPGAGEPPGRPLRELLQTARAGPDDSRAAFARGVAALATALDRRVEGIELGLDGAVRVRAAPGQDGEGGDTFEVAHVAAAGLVPPDLDEAIVDGVLDWSTAPLDRHRMRDRLRDLRLLPWGEVTGDGAAFRLAAARAAVARLVQATADFEALPPPDLLVVGGGAWGAAPGPAIALALADVVRRPGACQLVHDHARLLAPLGTIPDPVERRRLVGALAGDLLAPLGTVVMPRGMRAGRSGGRLVVHGTDGASELDLIPGGLELVDLPPGETAVAEFRFRDAVELGTRGRHFAVDVAGGLGGLLVDLRDVPLRLPERPDRRRELLAAWQGALWPGLEA